MGVKSSIIPLHHNHINYQQLFRNRSFCLYHPNNLEITANMLLLCVSSLCSLGLLIHFIFIKGLGERPGDILFMASLGDLISTVNQIVVNLYCLGEGAKAYDDSLFYTLANHLDVLVENMINFYYISFCLFHACSIQCSLKGSSVPSFFYHLGPLFMSAVCWYAFFKFKGVESVWITLFGFGLTAEIILSVVKYSALTYMTLSLAKRIKAYLPEYRRIYEARQDFLDYYSKYLVTLRYVYLGKAFIEITTSVLVNKGLNENTSRLLNITMLAGHMLTGTFPIILTFARFNDPLIKKYWHGLVHGRPVAITDKDKNVKEIVDPTEKKGKLAIASALIEKSLKIKPQLQQIKYCRKVQVLYSILSGIHYFWHMRETGKLAHYAKTNHISLLNKIKDSELRQEKFKVKHKLKVKHNHLKKEVPQIYNEVKSRGYNLAQGKFTSYAQEAFQEIIKLDNAENEITKSLDLKENLNRISNSGLNKAGKSGEFFFFSKDNKFVIKTVSIKEVRTLLKILPKYTQYFKKNPHSLIAKIYGLFSFKVGYSYEKFYFILMRNLNDCPNDSVCRKYDLKGSTVGRRTIKKEGVPESELHTYDTLKDLDFNKYEKKISLNGQVKDNLLSTVQKDADFLSSLGLIDYSMILFIIAKKEQKENLELSLESINSSNSTCASEVNEDHNQFSLIESADGKFYYKVGIIDYLTEFGLFKKFEIFFKKLIALNPNHNISAQRPLYYGERFVKYFSSLVE